MLLSPTTKHSVPVPGYQPPSHGFLSLAPRSWIPYLELTRIEKPIETWITYAPFLFGSLYGACITHPIPKPLTMLTANMTLAVVASLLHSAGCTWNDIIDRDVDRQVTRCRFRPIARGAVSPRNGYIFFATQLVLCLGILWETCREGMSHAVLYIVLGLIYPFTKRFTNYPQLILGFTIAWGFVIGFVAIRINPHILGPNTTSSLIWLFLSQVAWSVIGDTIYAYQDVDDDLKAGVKSMAVTYRNSLKVLLSCEVALQVVSLLLAGKLMDASTIYYLGAGVGNGTFLSLMVFKIDLKNPQDCGWWFRNGNWLVGGTLMVGLLGEYVTRLTI